MRYVWVLYFVLSTSTLLMASGGQLVTQTTTMRTIKMALVKNKVKLLTSSILRQSKVNAIKQEQQTLQMAVTFLNLIGEQSAYIEENGALLDEMADILVRAVEFILLKETGWFYQKPTEEHHQAYQLILTPDFSVSRLRRHAEVRTSNSSGG